MVTTDLVCSDEELDLYVSYLYNAIVLCGLPSSSR